MKPFVNEEAYRDWVQVELASLLGSAGSKYLVLRSKNVNDIIVCKSADGLDLALFVEVKYHRAAFGRIGLGDGRGQGFQPEILVRRPGYFERNLRWLIGSEAGVAVLVPSDTPAVCCRRRVSRGKAEQHPTRHLQRRKSTLSAGRIAEGCSGMDSFGMTTPNSAFERTAGSHALAASAQRERYAFMKSGAATS